MKEKIIFMLLLISTSIFGQDTLKMDYFSKEYKLLIISNNCNSDSCFGKTNIFISNRTTHKLISQILVENFIADNGYVTKGKTTNLIPNPIYFDDYNFDGTMDLRIRNGYDNNGYAKFDFYIMNNIFYLDSALTYLSKTKGTVFTLTEKKQLELIEIGIHNYRVREFYDYTNANKKLQLNKRIIEDGKTNPKYLNVTTESYNNNKKTVVRKKYLIGKYLWDEI